MKSCGSSVCGCVFSELGLSQHTALALTDNSWAIAVKPGTRISEGCWVKRRPLQPVLPHSQGSHPTGEAPCHSVVRSGDTEPYLAMGALLA